MRWQVLILRWSPEASRWRAWLMSPRGEAELGPEYGCSPARAIADGWEPLRWGKSRIVFRKPWEE